MTFTLSARCPIKLDLQTYSESSNLVPFQPGHLIKDAIEFSVSKLEIDIYNFLAISLMKSSEILLCRSLVEIGNRISGIELTATVDTYLNPVQH